MRSATIFASALAFAVSALAQTPGFAVVSAPGEGEVVPSGKTYTIKWSAGKFNGPASISLMGGNDPTTLQVLNAIAGKVNIEDESYAWAVDCSLGEQKTYGLKISDLSTDGGIFQYSFPFQIKGPSCGSSSSSSSSASASATASATGYPTKVPSETPSHTKAPSSYPVETSTSSIVSTSTVVSSSSIYSNTTTTAKSSTSLTVTPTTLATKTSSDVYVTETSVVTSSSGVPATSTTSSVPVPTAGAARTGAGLALGLIAAALAL